MPRSHPHFSHFYWLGILGVIAAVLAIAEPPVAAQNPDQASNQAIKGPWLDKSLSPDKRADLLIEQMTLDEKIALVHGSGRTEPPGPAQWLGGAGFVPGIPRLGNPRSPDDRREIGRRQHGVAWPLRDGVALRAGCAASWDPKMAYEYGALLGKEARDLGFNVSLGGTANIIREPRNGRNYECFGEDPILIGKMLGRELKGRRTKGSSATSTAMR